MNETIKWLLCIVVIPIALIFWKLLYLRDKREERDELVKAIRVELIKVREDIIKEIRLIDK